MYTVYCQHCYWFWAKKLTEFTLRTFTYLYCTSCDLSNVFLLWFVLWWKVIKLPLIQDSRSEISCSCKNKVAVKTKSEQNMYIVFFTGPSIDTWGGGGGGGWQNLIVNVSSRLLLLWYVKDVGCWAILSRYIFEIHRITLLCFGLKLFFLNSGDCLVFQVVFLQRPDY